MQLNRSPAQPNPKLYGHRQTFVKHARARVSIVTGGISLSWPDRFFRFSLPQRKTEKSGLATRDYGGIALQK